MLMPRPESGNHFVHDFRGTRRLWHAPHALQGRLPARRGRLLLPAGLEPQAPQLGMLQPWKVPKALVPDSSMDTYGYPLSYRYAVKIHRVESPTWP